MANNPQHPQQQDISNISSPSRGGREGSRGREGSLALFDMDGVLYNSMPNHARAWHESMASFGIDMDPKEAYLYEGMRGTETIKLLVEKQQHRIVSEEEAKEMYRVKSEYYAKCPTADLIPGVHHLQEEMKRLGLDIGIVTGSGQPTLIERILRDFDGLVNPDIMVTALNVNRGKPAPDPYLKGMQMAGALPHQTLVVENAPLGVRAGVAAGAFVVAVNTGPLPDSTLANEGANLVFHTMDEFCIALPDILSAK